MQASVYLGALLIVTSVVYLVGRIFGPIASPPPQRIPARVWLRPVPVAWGIMDAVGTVVVIVLAALGASVVVGLGLFGLVCLGVL